MPYSDSAQVEITLEALGVWIHDPDDPEGTIRQYFYGASQRSDDYSAMGQGTYYAGREDPVYDFGEHRARSASCMVDIPRGPEAQRALQDLRAFAASRKPVWYRDNRGRAFYGPIMNLRVTDTDWGQSVSFTVETSDRPVAETLASLTEPAAELEQP